MTRGIDRALDAIGGEALEASLQLVADRQRIATIVEDRIEEEGLLKMPTDRSAKRLSDLCALWERGELRVHVSNEYPMTQAAAAHREVETGHVRGKIVLSMST